MKKASRWALLGLWVFPSILITYATDYALVRTFCYQIEHEEQNFFQLKASIYSLWLPSVVGDDQSNTFLVSTISTLVMKTLIVAVALTYAFLGVQEQIHPHPFLLWCEEEWTEESSRNLTICSNVTSCFVFYEEEQVTQKLRLCSPEETTLWILLILALILSNCLSLAASVRLNMISNYVVMYKATHKFLWCFPSDPILHRSAIFTLVKSDNDKEHKQLKGMIEAVKNKSDIIDRPNSDGNSPLHAACESNSPRQAALLLKNNAKLQANDQDDMPIFSLLNSNDESAVESFLEVLQQDEVDLLPFVNKPNSSKTTALHKVCEESLPREAFLLMKHGAKVNHENEVPAIADVMISLVSSDEEGEKELFDQMLDLPNISDFVNLKDRAGRTVLHVVCQRSLPTEALLLIQKGAHAQVDRGNRMPAMAEQMIADILISLIISNKEEDTELFGDLMVLPNIPDFVNLRTPSVQHLFTLPVRGTCPKKPFC